MSLIMIKAIVITAFVEKKILQDNVKKLDEV